MIHIWLTITGIPLLIVAAPLFPFIHTRMMIVAVGVSIFIALVAAARRAWFDVGLSSFIALSFGVSRVVFSETDERTLALRTAAILSFVLLHAVLLIGPWSRWSRLVLRSYRHRRHLGVTAFLLGLLHFSLVFTVYFDRSFVNAFMAFFTFFGFTALFIMFILALTSWDWQQKHVPGTWWRRGHIALFFVYLGLVGYALSISQRNSIPIERSTWVLLVIFLLFWVFCAPWGLAPRFMRMLLGWKQLHVLVHVAYLSLLAHVWFGVVFAQPRIVQITFLGMMVLVWGSHLAGWIMHAHEEKRLRQIDESAQVVTREDGVYQSLVSEKQFVEGKGKAFMVKGRRTAIFRYRGRFFGLFGFCAHQKGPIADGAIVNGYVECPWHGWQYGCEDGTAPPPFKDRLAFYPCLVLDEIVYVRITPRAAGEAKSG